MEGIPAHSRGWNQMIFKVPSNPNHSVIDFGLCQNELECFTFFSCLPSIFLWITFIGHLRTVNIFEWRHWDHNIYVSNLNFPFFSFPPQMKGRELSTHYQKTLQRDCTEDENMNKISLWKTERETSFACRKMKYMMHAYSWFTKEALFFCGKYWSV